MTPSIEWRPGPKPAFVLAFGCCPKCKHRLATYARNTNEDSQIEMQPGFEQIEGVWHKTATAANRYGERGRITAMEPLRRRDYYARRESGRRASMVPSQQPGAELRRVARADEIVACPKCPSQVQLTVPNLELDA